MSPIQGSDLNCPPCDGADAIPVIARMDRILDLSRDLAREMERDGAAAAHLTLRVAQFIQAEISEVVAELHRGASPR